MYIRMYSKASSSHERHAKPFKDYYHAIQPPSHHQQINLQFKMLHHNTLMESPSYQSTTIVHARPLRDSQVSNAKLIFTMLDAP